MIMKLINKIFISKQKLLNNNAQKNLPTTEKGVENPQMRSIFNVQANGVNLL
jgi:hypothetical protein